MITLKVLKNDNKIFKALSMGMGNTYAYDVIVDKKIVADIIRNAVLDCKNAKILFIKSTFKQ